MKNYILLLLLGYVISSDQIPGENQSKAILLKGGTIHPISSEQIIADVLIKNGKIFSELENMRKFLAIRF